MLSTFCPRKLRPTVDPVCEASALVTWEEPRNDSESGAVRVMGAPRRRSAGIAGRPETGLPDKVLNHPEIEYLADDSGSCQRFLPEPTKREISLTATSIDLAPGLDRGRGAYTGPK